MENKEHCTEKMWRNVLNTCLQAKELQISDKPNPNDDDLDSPPECQLKMIDPDVNRPLRSLGCVDIRVAGSSSTTRAIHQRASSSWTNQSCERQRYIFRALNLGAAGPSCRCLRGEEKAPRERMCDSRQPQAALFGLLLPFLELPELDDISSN